MRGLLYTPIKLEYNLRGEGEEDEEDEEKAGFLSRTIDCS